jgi:hypothetical protein
VAKDGNGEFEHHVVGVRLRVKGAGNLQLTLKDLDDVQQQPLVAVPMNAVDRFEPFRLADFQSQRIRLRGETIEINEIMEIRRVIIFAKPVAAEYPS